jgi:hypothetical protein
MKYFTILTVAAFAATASIAPTALAQTAVTQTTTTNSIGTITDFSPDTIVVRTETAPEPIRYSYTKTTTYVDETGNPVPMSVVRSGLPVTVYYTKDGDRMVASRVVVKKTTTTSPAPVVEEKKTTTTTTTTKKPD